VIRTANPGDVSGMVTLFEAHHAKMGCTWSIDTAVLRRTFSRAISAPDTWLCITGDSCLFLAACFESPLGAGKLATELCLAASPGNLDEILNRYEAWALAKGCSNVSLGCMERPEVFERMYRRRGYLWAESTFRKVL
jgi:hypothetical protein